VDLSIASVKDPDIVTWLQREKVGHHGSGVAFNDHAHGRARVPCVDNLAGPSGAGPIAKKLNLLKYKNRMLPSG